eukprot:TRINITY_DN1269_c0_g1_i4.p1 TRINITY_DN1269_c0_g1~~TRINITY_DN1269_c0_g1_i4.p1  ORF type:complete len:188 (-),score=34.29 TRINITY_DN1269_c0_g1_i4:43-606(-)
MRSKTRFVRMKLFCCVLLLICSANCGPLVVNTFSWDSCGSSSDPLVVKSITVAPDPVVLGENATISFAFSLAETLTGGQLELTIEKKVFGVWTEIPCVDGVGSCTISDFCSLLTPDNSLCKPPFSTYGLPCVCPIAAGSYALPLTSVFLKNPDFSWVDGDFYVKAEASDTNNNQISCYEIYLSLTSS